VNPRRLRAPGVIAYEKFSLDLPGHLSPAVPRPFRGGEKVCAYSPRLPIEKQKEMKDST
jgi:hypothetical protein